MNQQIILGFRKGLPKKVIDSTIKIEDQRTEIDLQSEVPISEKKDDGQDLLTGSEVQEIGTGLWKG